MFELKKNKVKKNKILNSVKEKYKKICDETILSWGSERIPSRTLNKFLDFAKYLGDKTFEKVIQALIDKSLNP